VAQSLTLVDGVAEGLPQRALGRVLRALDLKLLVEPHEH
jgi:hypothetical protein